MIGASAAISMRWFGVDGPAISEKYWSHSVYWRANAKYGGMSASVYCTLCSWSEFRCIHA